MEVMVLFTNSQHMMWGGRLISMSRNMPVLSQLWKLIGNRLALVDYCAFEQTVHV